ncbi:MAG: hypothetical protein ABSF29_00855 [Tepidisphaeraceae bacterium]|jgi:hypothetical protein
MPEPPLLQQGIAKLRYYLNRAHIPTRRDDIAILRLKNRHRGRRCFVIGTGPSLRMDDLDKLAEQGELCLASNNIFLAFDSTRWRPTYYAVEDHDLAIKSREQINRRVHCPTLIPKYLLPVLGRARNRTCFRLLWRVPPPNQPEFSRNLLRGINCGGTITYTLLQIAAWMGFAESYLLGVDFSYDLGKISPSTEFEGQNTYSYRTKGVRNHFAPEYFKEGQTVIAPDLESSLRAYQSALARCHSEGPMKIFNATRGGRLELFPRVDFDSLF